MKIFKNILFTLILTICLIFPSIAFACQPCENIIPNPMHSASNADLIIVGTRIGKAPTKNPSDSVWTLNMGISNSEVNVIFVFKGNPSSKKIIVEGDSSICHYYGLPEKKGMYLLFLEKISNNSYREVFHGCGIGKINIIILLIPLLLIISISIIIIRLKSKSKKKKFKL